MKKIKYKDLMHMILGTMIYSIAITWFAKPNKIVTGGVTGVSIILTNMIKKIFDYEVSISFLVLILNIPIFIFSFIVSGNKFVKKSAFTTITMSVWLAVFDKLPCFFKIENDMFITSILIGAVGGTGTGLILKVGASSGGTDMLANSINKIFPQFAISKIIFTLDTSIVLLGFLIFGPTKTTYAIISIFISSKIINNILGGLRFARAVFIITSKVDDISNEIFKKLKRGNTNLSCTGMYTKKQKNLLIVVVRPKEIIKLKKIIESKDKDAFVVISPAQEVLGNFIN